jgi:DNA polymerase-1
MSKLILIDGNAILHRAYHALPPLTTKRGEPVNAVYGLVSMLLRVIQDLKPTHIAVAFDRKEPTFRHKEFKPYQAQRPPTEKALSSQFEKAKDVLYAIGIPVYEKAGYEADDILGTLAAQATRVPKSKVQIPKSKKIDEVVIVTGDKDILQLVDDKRNIKVYFPKRGLSDAQLMGEEEVVEKLEVTPKQIVDYKSLVGDPSDNYPGIRGIGPKTAIALLSKYKSKNEIYRKLKEISSSTREKLVKGKGDAELSYKLAKIVRDVKFKHDIDSAKAWKVDSDNVLNLFSEFGFRTLTKRVKKVGEEIEKERQGSLF